MGKLKWLCGLVVLVGVGFAFTELTFSQSCSSCAPEDSGTGWRLDTGDVTNVCFRSGDFSSGLGSQEEAMTWGFTYWQDYLQSMSETVTPEFTFNPSETCDIVIMKQPPSAFPSSSTVAAAAGNDNPSSAKTILINSDFVSGSYSQDFWSWVMAHEVGHLQGFGDVTSSSCSQWTVMNDPISTSVGGLGGASCSDQIAATNRYYHSNENYSGAYGDNTVEVDPPGYGGYECTVEWLVTEYYFWNGEEWEFWYSTWEIVDVFNCYPI